MMNLNLVGSVATDLKKAGGNVASAVAGVQAASRVMGFTRGTPFLFVLWDTLFEMPPSWTVSSAIPISIASCANFKPNFGKSRCFAGRNFGVAPRIEPMMQLHVAMEVTPGGQKMNHNK